MRQTQKKIQNRPGALVTFLCAAVVIVAQAIVFVPTP